MNKIVVDENVKHILVDCDGTLAETQPAHCAAYRHSFEYYNIPFTDEEFYKYSNFGGKYLKQKMIIEKNYNPELFDKIAELKSEIIGVYLDKYMIPNKELINFIMNNTHNYTFTLVSNGKRHSIETILKKLNIFNCFNIILTAEDYTKAKPNPDPYLLAVSKLNAKVENCLIFEDNEVGFEAANAANIKYIKVKVKG